MADNIDLVLNLLLNYCPAAWHHAISWTSFTNPTCSVSNGKAPEVKQCSVLSSCKTLKEKQLSCHHFVDAKIGMNIVN